MSTLRKGIQRLFQSLPRRIEDLLRLEVLLVAVHVELVTACADQGRWEELGSGDQEIRRERSDLGRSESQLARWGLYENILSVPICTE